MLIQKLLNKHKVSDYYLADCASEGGCGRISLLRRIDYQFYDVDNKYYVPDYDVVYKKKLTDYVECDKQYISDRKAQELAEPYYDACYDEFIEMYNKSQEAKPSVGIEIC